VKCAQLVVIAPDHKVVYVSNGASEIVAKVGGLPGMPYHLRILGSCLELRKAELMKAWAQKKLKQPRVTYIKNLPAALPVFHASRSVLLARG